MWFLTKIFSLIHQYLHPPKHLSKENVYLKKIMWKTKVVKTMIMVMKVTQNQGSVSKHSNRFCLLHDRKVMKIINMKQLAALISVIIYLWFVENKCFRKLGYLTSCLIIIHLCDWFCSMYISIYYIWYIYIYIFVKLFVSALLS